MSALEMREAIDLVDTGLPDHPDLPAIMAGGRRRRRRRTQAVWGSTAFATVAAVAQLSFLAGAQLGRTTGDPAAAGTRATGFGADMGAAVIDIFPSATLMSSSETFGRAGRAGTARVRGALALGDGRLLQFVPLPERSTWAAMQVYTTPGMRSLTVLSLVGQPAFELSCGRAERLCQRSTVDGRRVTIWDAAGPDDHAWVRTVQVSSDGVADEPSTVTVSALLNGFDWSVSNPDVPSVSTLTALALDDRLVPPEQ